jgi:hypothetical protein
MAIVFVLCTLDWDQPKIESGIQYKSMNGITSVKPFEKLISIDKPDIEKMNREARTMENLVFSRVFSKIGFKRAPGGDGLSKVFPKREFSPAYKMYLNRYYLVWRIEDRNKTYNELLTLIEKNLLKLGPYVFIDGLFKLQSSNNV